METKEGYFEHFTNNSVPTPTDQEDVTSTDLISKAVEKMIDNLTADGTNDKNRES